MDDVPDGHAAEAGADSCAIRDIGFDESNLLRNELAATGAEIVENHGSMPRRQQVEHNVAADISGSAGHEDVPQAAPSYSDLVLSGSKLIPALERRDLGVA